MKIIQQSRYLITVVMLATCLRVFAGYPVKYEASFTRGDGSGTFAPYYESSLRHGRFTQSSTALLEVGAWREMDNSKRFSYGFGIDVAGGYASSTDYERYDLATKSWSWHGERPSAVWIQQLYGEVKYRSLFLELGMKERGSAMLNQALTSGDLIESGNTRPMPQLRAGFVDFKDIPLTNGWVQISGELGYGKMLDYGWLKDHYNYYNYHITDGQWYNYKRLYFRTKPSKPFSMTIGMQAAATFGGETWNYYFGKMTRHDVHSESLKTFLKMIIPLQDGGEDFYTGNHLGSWDIRGRYRLGNGAEISAYTSWLWEDGSGIGKLNGFDGLWGIEYKAPRRGIVNGAVVEYLDFTNQSGPIHYAPGDFDGTNLTDHVSGADDYYNNAMYNSYAYFGMSIGSPAMMAPIYNRDGYPAYVGNAMRGFHVGVDGSLSANVDYRVKGGYRKAWGTPMIMLTKPLHLTAVMLEATWRSPKLEGLSVNAQVEIDRGNMPCNTFGAMVGIRYQGLLNL
ncbi:MAG: capsule assembly Wzi family protein [Staphylococcus sp.]|nr:capsule assembly Wzi family protein [Staphylococcus sp.]